MAYADVEAIKMILEIDTTKHDAILATMASQAQSVVDELTGYEWEAGADSTKRFTVGLDTVGSELHFGRFCAEITTITNDADAGAPDVLASSDFVTIPQNGSAFTGVKLLASSGKVWTYTSDPEMGITVEGKWARAVEAPDWVALAATRLAVFWYRKRTSQEFDVVGIPPNTILKLPGGIPQDVAELIEEAGRTFI